MNEPNEFSILKSLLSSWNLAQLHAHFQDEGINIEELQLMKSHHIGELLHNYKMGVRIRFEHHFEKWRRNLNKPLQSCGVANCNHTCAGAIRNPKEEPQPQPQQYQQQHQQSTEVKKPPQLQTRATNTDFVDFLNTRANTPTPPPPLRIPPPPTSTMTKTPQSELLKEMPKLTPQPRPIEKPRPAPAMQSPKSSILVLGGETLNLHQLPLPLYDKPPMNLVEILQTSGPKGTSLLEYYREHQVLMNTHRTLLIHLIVTFFEANDYHLSLNMSHNLETQILKLFPTEKLENYRTEKRGRIYVKFCNMKRYKRERCSLKRKWDGVSLPQPMFHLAPDVELAEVNAEEDDEFAISFDSWADQQHQQPVEVQVKAENLSEDGY